MRNFIKYGCVGLGLALLVACCRMVPFASHCSDISERVIRLHILADSDEAAAQTLKLAVRDRILTETAGRLRSAVTKAEAETQISALMPEIEACIQDELTKRGSDLPFTVALAENVPFTTRQYGAYTLPAGKYEALQVTLGRGQGHNWWCIVFPPLCLTPTLGSEDAQTALEAILSEEEMEIVSDYPHYSVRFKLWEWGQALWTALCP